MFEISSILPYTFVSFPTVAFMLSNPSGTTTHKNDNFKKNIYFIPKRVEIIKFYF